jgi:hypothetical protein
MTAAPIPSASPLSSSETARRNARTSRTLLSALGIVCLIAGLASVGASLAIWFMLKTDDPAHAERFGIFVGLWAPTFLILSVRFRPARG